MVTHGVKRGLATMAIWLTAFSASAHPADISYLRVKVQRQRLDLRFTFNLLSLTRFVRIDADADNRITKAELDAAETTLRKYFAKHIQIRINDQESSLGTPVPLVCVWPSPDGPPAAVAEDYGARHVDFAFSQEVKPVLEDVWIGFDIWQQTGPLGTVEGTFEQDGTITKVPFTPDEADYLHDTGYVAADAPLKHDPFAESASGRPPEAVTPTLRRWEVGTGTFVVLVAVMIGMRRKMRRAKPRGT